MDTIVLNVRMPNSLLKKIEKESRIQGYTNKSEYVREAIRRMIQPSVREKILEELIKRSIEVRHDYVEHRDVVKKITKVKDFKDDC